MTITRKLLIGAAVPAMLLCGCAKKVSFADFQKAVSEIKIPEDFDVKKVELSVKGKQSGIEIDDSVTYEGNSAEEIFVKFEADALIHPVREVYNTIIGSSVFEYAEKEISTLTYYAGSTFKVEGEMNGAKGKAEFDKYGNCTYVSASSNDADLTIKCSYTYTK